MLFLLVCRCTKASGSLQILFIIKKKHTQSLVKQGTLSLLEALKACPLRLNLLIIF